MLRRFNNTQQVRSVDSCQQGSKLDNVEGKGHFLSFLEVSTLQTIVGCLHSSVLNPAVCFCTSLLSLVLILLVLQLYILMSSQQQAMQQSRLSLN